MDSFCIAFAYIHFQADGCQLINENPTYISMLEFSEISFSSVVHYNKMYFVIAFTLGFLLGPVFSQGRRELVIFNNLIK